MEIPQQYRKYIFGTSFVLLIIFCVYFGVKTVLEFKNFRMMGMTYVSLDGKGEVSSAPDLATINFTIKENDKLTKDAQDKVSVKEKVVLVFLDKSGIEKKDIKAESVNFYPQYDYGIPCISQVNVIDVSCQPTLPKIIGYEASEYITVKIHDITKAGEIVSGLAELKVFDMNGPNYSIENEENLKAQARKLAIADAKNKAKILAQDLGLHLGKVTSFMDNNTSSGYPAMYEKLSVDMGMGDSDIAIPAPSLPSGENKIISNVTITYDLR